MPRYFYTDPLAAAWMAKHFGMQFESDPRPITYSFLHNDITESGHLYCIHAESLRILEPKIGDTLRLYFYSPEEDNKHGALMTGFYAGGGEAITWFRNPRDGSIEKELHQIQSHQWHIIQRDGLAFHWPESEE